MITTVIDIPWRSSDFTKKENRKLPVPFSWHKQKFMFLPVVIQDIKKKKKMTVVVGFIKKNDKSLVMQFQTKDLASQRQ